MIQAFALRVNIATVTGEAHPVARVAAPSSDADTLHTRTALRAGTTIVGGSPRAVVIATGMRTEFGRIARLAQTTEEAPSPLRRELSVLSRIIAVLAVTIGVLVFTVGEWLGVSRRANFVCSRSGSSWQTFPRDCSCPTESRSTDTASFERRNRTGLQLHAADRDWE